MFLRGSPINSRTLVRLYRRSPVFPRNSRKRLAKAPSPIRHNIHYARIYVRVRDMATRYWDRLKSVLSGLILTTGFVASPRTARVVRTGEWPDIEGFMSSWRPIRCRCFVGYLLQPDRTPPTY